jgi:DNA-binding MarR family transcriptional regulator
MPSADPLAETFREWLKTFMRRSMRDLMLYSKEHDLSMSQIFALGTIERKNVSGVSDIGENMGISRAAASQMLERLVQQGLVLRTEDPHDRRAKQLVLTNKGHQVLKDTMNARGQWLDELVAVLSPTEREQIGKAFNVLLERTRQLELQAEQ